MPTFDFICTNKKCKFEDEFNTSKSVPKDMRPPEKCPKCKKGKMKKSPILCPVPFDVIGGYEYQYGKKGNWKKDIDTAADVLNGKKSPY